MSTQRYAELEQHYNLETQILNFLSGKKGINQATVQDIETSLKGYQSLGCCYNTWSISKLLGFHIANLFVYKLSKDKTSKLNSLIELQSQFYGSTCLGDISPEEINDGYQKCQPYILSRQRIAKEHLVQLSSKKGMRTDKPGYTRAEQEQDRRDKRNQ